MHLGWIRRPLTCNSRHLTTQVSSRHGGEAETSPTRYTAEKVQGGRLSPSWIQTDKHAHSRYRWDYQGTYQEKGAHIQPKARTRTQGAPVEYSPPPSLPLFSAETLLARATTSQPNHTLRSSQHPTRASPAQFDPRGAERNVLSSLSWRLSKPPPPLFATWAS